MASSQLIALLGLLAVAGYQNREKLGAMLRPSPGTEGGRSDGADQPGAAANANGVFGGLLKGLGGIFGAGNSSAGIAGGLRELVDQFTQKGQGAAARSWIETGPNRDIEGSQLEEALGEDTISALTLQTGLPRAELLERLRAVLPSAVDKLTPLGHLPTAEQVDALAARA